MGGLSSMPSIPRDFYATVGAHENLKEAYLALDFLSQRGDMQMKRKDGVFSISVMEKGEYVSSSGKTLCSALKGLLEKVNELESK